MKKNNMKNMGLLASLIGMILYRVLDSYYGVSGVKLLGYICVSICLFIVLCLIVTKNFLAALLSSMMVLPIVVMSIGMYLDNLLVLGGGLILLFIMLFVLIKICKK